MTRGAPTPMSCLPPSLVPTPPSPSWVGQQAWFVPVTEHTTASLLLLLAAATLHHPCTVMQVRHDPCCLYGRCLALIHHCLRVPAGAADAKQAAGLHPLMRARMMVRYAGIANSPVKAAFKVWCQRASHHPHTCCHLPEPPVHPTRAYKCTSDYTLPWPHPHPPTYACYCMFWCMLLPGNVNGYN
jgi:hypothetical protein